MGFRYESKPGGGPIGSGGPIEGLEPGKRSRAMQLRASARGTAPREDLLLIAARGVEGGGDPLPFAGTIQHAFGHHDVSGVSAHVGGAAAEASAAIGARAYATGGDVAFASSPDLHTAAHEAAHVVQQRGGVHLAGGVGEVGDVYEQHADAVADLVVRGDSAEALLDQHAGLGSAGGPAVQMDGPYDPAQLDRLVADTIAALTMNETGGATQATPSRMGTSAHVPASYASSTQMIPRHAVGVLRDLPEYATAQGISSDEVDQAAAIMDASMRIWHRLVEHGGNISDCDPADLELTAFTTEELTRMMRFGQVQARLLAQQSRFDALSAAVSTWLQAQVAVIGAQIDAADSPAASASTSASTGTGTSTTTAAAPAPQDEHADAGGDDAASEPSAPVVGGDEVQTALDALPPRQAARVAALRSFALPSSWAHMTASHRHTWLAGARRRVHSAERNIAATAPNAAAALIARELVTDEHVAALGLTEGDLRAYIHGRTGVDFHRWGEDMNGWNRLALQHNTELHPPATADGAAPRTLDGAIASAVEAEGGHQLSRAEYDHFIRTYVAAHPTATDEQVVRAAAHHQGSDPGYADQTWTNFVAIHGAGAAAAPTTGGPTTAAPTTPTTPTP